MTGSPVNEGYSGFCGKQMGGHLTRTECRNCKKQDEPFAKYNFIFFSLS